MTDVFNANKPCPACGCGSRSDHTHVYHPDNDRQEQIVSTCGRCGYRWKSLPLFAKVSEDATVQNAWTWMTEARVREIVREVLAEGLRVTR